MRSSTLLLGVGLAGALGLWLWSRTKAGQGATQSAFEFIDVSASRIRNALVSRGYRNNNPGNVRFIAGNPWDGQIGNDGGYAVYDTPLHGTRALGKELLKRWRAGFNTVRDLIAGRLESSGERRGGWAPASENNTEAYIQDMADQIGVGADERINVPALLIDLARAIAKHENGYLDSSYDWSWADLP